MKLLQQKHVIITILIGVIIFLCFGTAKSQGEKELGLYEAAIELSKLIDNSNKLNVDAANKIFTNAGFQIGELSSIDNFLLRKYSTKPCFLNPLTNELDCTSSEPQEGFIFMAPKSAFGGAAASASGKSIGKSIASLPVTNLADGISVFLVNRTKKELSVAFFDRLTNRIQQIPALVQNFPSTSLQMNAIGTDIYQYEKFIQSLRQAFITDFKGLPGNFGRYIMSNEELIKRKAPRAIAGDGLHMMQSFISAKNFSSIIRYLSSDTSYIQTTGAPELELLQGVLKTTDVVLHAFQKPDESWIDFNDFNKMMQNEKQLDMFFALILLEANKRQIVFPDGLTFSQILANQDHVKSQLSGMIFQVNQLLLYLKNVNAEANKNANLEDYYNLLNSLFAVAETGFRLLPDGVGIEKEEARKFFTVAQSLSSLTLYIYQKKYSASVTQMASVLKELKIIDNGSPTLATKGKGLKNQKQKQNQKLEKRFDQILRYANFFALIAEAEDGNTLASIIDQFAAPVGSSVEKRKNSFTMGINGYVGVVYGQEIANTSLILMEDLKREPFYGLSAPVGISMNIGIQKFSIGTFFSLIDVGAITAFRFDDENTQDLPEVTIGNIFAPGIHLELGYGSIPLVIGYGWQGGPNLRKVTNEALEVTEFSVLRRSAFIRVDIPMAWF
jgi:hypothetical protein